MKTNKNSNYVLLNNQKVLDQIKKAIKNTPDETLAEEATLYYSEELFNFDLEKINTIEIDLSEFKSEI